MYTNTQFKLKTQIATTGVMNIRGLIVIIFEKQTFFWTSKRATIQLSNTDIQVTYDKQLIQ